MHSVEPQVLIVAQELHIAGEGLVSSHTLLHTYTCCRLTCTITLCPLYHLPCITSSGRAFNLHTECSMKIAVDSQAITKTCHVTQSQRGGKCLVTNCSDAIVCVYFISVNKCLKMDYFALLQNRDNTMRNSPNVLLYTSGYVISND